MKTHFAFSSFVAIIMFAIFAPQVQAADTPNSRQRFFLKNFYHLHDSSPEIVPNNGTVVVMNTFKVNMAELPDETENTYREVDRYLSDNRHDFAPHESKISFVGELSFNGSLDVPDIVPEDLLQKWRGGFQMGNTTMYISGGLKFKLSSHDGQSTWLNIKSFHRGIKLGWEIDN